MPNRTPGDRERRRIIADAASNRTAVVLYACLPPGQDTKPVMDALRTHAKARDWVVIEELCDRQDVATPLSGRRHWPRVEELLTTGKARGIVTHIKPMCGYYGNDRARTQELLISRGAFLSCAMRAHQGPVTAAGGVR